MLSEQVFFRKGTEDEFLSKHETVQSKRRRCLNAYNFSLFEYSGYILWQNAENIIVEKTTKFKNLAHTNVGAHVKYLENVKVRCP